MSLPEIIKEKLIHLGARLDDPYLVAVSGGPDSTALLLASLAALGIQAKVTVAHLNHNVRPGSKLDQEKVAELCDRSEVALVTGRLDSEELNYHRRTCGSLEGAMRFLRYRFLFDTAAKVGSKWILTGHTADDQAETILFRMTRKMDWRSLGGIPEKRGMILRPLLGVPGRATLSYCQEMGIIPVSDPTNLDEIYARSRIRNRILPGLAAGFDNDILNLLRRVGKVAEGMSSAEKRLLDKSLTGSEYEETGLIQLETVLALPGSLQRPLIVNYLMKMLKEYPSINLVDDVLEFVLAGRNGSLSLPGDMILTLSYGSVHIGKSDTLLEHGLPTRALELKVPGSLSIPSAGLAVTAMEDVLGTPGIYPSGKVALLSRKGVAGSLWVRKRLPGDRFRPMGMEKDKKLKDFLVDRKIPRTNRDRIPIVLDEQNDIVWVGGVEISQKAALEGTEGEEAILIRIVDLTVESV
jgi:tRNA(Ile)-lysidine synthase